MPTPELGLRDLPYDCAEAVFGSYLRTLESYQLHSRLLACSRIILGPSAADGAAADPDHTVWKTACAALGLTCWRVEPTWRATFDRLAHEKVEVDSHILEMSDSRDFYEDELPTHERPLLIFHDACTRGWKALAASTVEKMADALHPDEAQTILLKSCRVGFTDLVVFALGLPGVKASGDAYMNNSPLCNAVCGGHLETVDVLLRLGGAAADILNPFPLPRGCEHVPKILEIAAKLPDDAIHKRLLVALEEEKNVESVVAKMGAL